MKRNPKNEWIMVPDAHPAIITPQEADIVYEQSEKRRHGHRIQMKRQYLLTGLLVCDLCGSAFTAHNHRTKGIVYYRCSLRNRRGGTACENKTCFDAEKIEKQVLDRVLEDLLEPQIFHDWLQEVNQIYLEQQMNLQPKRERLERELEEVTAKAERLVDAIAEATMPLDMIQPRLLELRQEKYRIEGELRALKFDIPDISIRDEEQLREYAQLLREAIEDTQTCRDVLSMLIKQIRVQPDGDCTLEYHVNAVVYPMISSATPLPILGKLARAA